jgi:hypothetical protein
MAASALARRRRCSGCLNVLRAGGAPDSTSASLLRQADGTPDGAPLTL